MEILKKQSNDPSICTKYWYFMAITQSKSHRADHIKNRMTASQYCSDSNFEALAKQFKHIREIDNLNEIKILFSKPFWKVIKLKANKRKPQILSFKLLKYKIIIHGEKKLSTILPEPKLIKKKQKLWMKSLKIARLWVNSI